MRRILFSMVMVAAAGSIAGAQYSGYPRVAEPAYWLSGGAGTFNAQGVNDGSTNSVWDFGQKTSFQYRATIEKAIQNQSAIGVAVNFVNAPLTYSSTGLASCPGCTSAGASCGSCAAHADVMTLMAMFHSGGGTGFHQILEFGAGATAYRNLKRDSDKAVLAPSGGNVDPTFGLGYGYGYGLSPNTEFMVVGDYQLILHESKNLPSGVSNTNTIRSIRMGLRYGFGSRGQVGRRR